MKKNNYKYDINTDVKITEEAAEIICSREPDVDFDFNQVGVVKSQYMINKTKMYEVKFGNVMLNLPQSYIEEASEN